MELKNKQTILNSLEMHLNQKNKYILFDADKTLIDYDSGEKFCDIANFDFMKIKNCFKDNGYSFETFYKVSQMYSSIDNKTFVDSTAKLADELEINKYFLDIMKKYQNQYNILIVTAGFRLLWEKVLIKYNLHNIKVFGGNNFKFDKYIIDDKSKGYIVDFLRDKNKYVISFGDSLVDQYMLLKSNESYLIVYDKKKNDIISVLRDKNHIKYISMNNLYLDELNNTTFEKLNKELN